jgi:hypothetical protein
MRTKSDTVGETKHPYAKSKISNGSRLLGPDADQRSTWARRMRDLIELHVADLGGENNVSVAEQSIIRRASALTTELERMETKFATENAASARDLDLYIRAAGGLRRLLETIGLERRPRDVTVLGSINGLPRLPPATPMRDHLKRMIEDIVEEQQTP